jgi:hypothetical protein
MISQNIEMGTRGFWAEFVQDSHIGSFCDDGDKRPDSIICNLQHCCAENSAVDPV